jgi:hypothetical protein
VIKKRFLVAALATGVVAAAPAVSHAGPPQCKKQKQGKNCPPAVKEGRMTGHGQQFNYQGFDKVQWEFRNSVCNSDRFPDLKVEFGGNTFILTQYVSPLTCFTLVPPTSKEQSPVAGFDSIRAQGTGTLNGVPGASIVFRFTDNGEPGINDTAEFTITRPGGGVAISYSGGAGDGGNHQAHRK